MQSFKNMFSEIFSNIINISPNKVKKKKNPKRKMRYDPKHMKNFCRTHTKTLKDGKKI